MRTRTLRLAILGYQAVLTYLFVVQTLAVTGIGRLPLSLVATLGPQLFLVETGILAMQFLGILALSLVNIRQRQEQTKPTQSVTQNG